MTDLPTKDEIVERLVEALTDDEDLFWVGAYRAECALNALTIPDLLALLRERGIEVQQNVAVRHVERKPIVLKED